MVITSVSFISKMIRKIVPVGEAGYVSVSDGIKGIIRKSVSDSRVGTHHQVIQAFTDSEYQKRFRSEEY